MDAVSAQAANPLRRLLSPKSIAVIGGKEAARVVRQCELLGFEGEIWPVHPSRADLNGRPCFRRLEDLPGVPDAAFIAIPREPTIEAVRVLRHMGAGGAVCYASGFAEVADGGALQADLVEAAGEMPLVGPNCYGLINALDRLALWPDNHGLEPIAEGAAIITQSGNMGINFTMGRRGLPLAALMSLGNQAAVGVTDCLEALLEDGRVKVIGLHIEGLDDVARFSRVAIRARAQGVPIVAFKSGRSEKGAQATVSHTSTLSGADALYDALFEHCGIARVHSVPAFLETLKLLCLFGPLPGNRIASLSCSGGEASLMADRADGTGLVFPDLEPDHADRVRASLNDYVEIANPLDYHTFIWGNRDATHATFSAMLSGGFDMTMLVLDFPTNESADCTDWNMTMQVFGEAARENGALGAVVATLPECMSEETARRLMAQGVAPLVDIDDALTAIAAASAIGGSRRNPAPLRAAGDPADNVRTLDEHESKALLAEAGLTIPEGRLVAPEEAVQAALEIGFPVVLKAVGAELAHKSEIGAVALNLSNDADVAKAAARLSKHAPALLVEKMVDGVGELIVGIARDRQFGPHLVIGAGGVLVELIKDTKILLLPTTRADVEAAIRGLKSAPLFDGFRGRSKGDIAAAVNAVMTVAAFAESYWTEIEELDINPLIVCAEDHGAVAADALIRLGEGEET